MKTPPSLFWVTVLCLKSFGGFPRTQGQEAALIQSFTIKEVFGVSHPNQIIDFDFSGSVDWTNAYMIGPDGNEAKAIGSDLNN